MGRKEIVLEQRKLTGAEGEALLASWHLLMCIDTERNELISDLLATAAEKELEQWDKVAKLLGYKSRSAAACVGVTFGYTALTQTVTAYRRIDDVEEHTTESGARLSDLDSLKE